MSTEIDPEWRTPSSETLFAALANLADTDEIGRFLRDLCTRRELEELSARWTVVELLDAGLSYRRIAEATGVSTTTITRINEWLHHGTGGYRIALDRSKGAGT